MLSLKCANLGLPTDPLLPTKAEVDEHYPLHLNYRSWCAHCVAGKARSNQHVQSKEDKEKLGVTWNMDYAFMSGEHNESEIGMQPALIFYDGDKDSCWAVAAEEKGATESMVKYGVGIIDESGYIWGDDHFQVRPRAVHSCVEACRVGSQDRGDGAY